MQSSWFFKRVKQCLGLKCFHIIWGFIFSITWHLGYGAFEKRYSKPTALFRVSLGQQALEELTRNSCWQSSPVPCSYVCSVFNSANAPECFQSFPPFSLIYVHFSGGSKYDPNKHWALPSLTLCYMLSSINVPSMVPLSSSILQTRKLRYRQVSLFS
jgi:hypothetical protein